MGRFRSACIFAFIFTVCKAQNSVGSEDLKSGPEISVEDEAKSGAHAESFISSDGGYAISQSNADTDSGSSLVQSSASLGGFGLTSAKASAHSNVASEQYIDSYGKNELNMLKPELQGLSSNKATSESVAEINTMKNLYDRSKPGVQLSPYSSGSSFQTLADAKSQMNNGGYYYNYHGLPSNYNLGPSSSQSEAQILPNMYEGSQDNIHSNPFYQGNQYPLSLYNLPSSPQAQVQNQAFINDVNNYNPVLSTYMREKTPGFNLYQLEYPENVKQNSAQSLSKAQAVLNANGGGYNPEMNGHQKMLYNPGLSISQSKVQALADVNYNSGLNPYVSVTGYPGYLKSSPTKEFTKAQALINSVGGGYSPGSNLFQPGYIPVIREPPQADPQVIANNVIDPYGAGTYLKKKPHSYQYGSNTGQMQAEALPGAYGNIGGFTYDQEQNAHASAEAQFVTSGSGTATANSQALSSGATGYSRLIPSHEYIMPHLIPGMEATIICTSVGDLYNLWLPVHECLVCACVIQTGILLPVCTRCDGCKTQTLEPVTETEPELIAITLKPPVRNEVTCNPLPNWQSFENPLNPCQVCICKEILNKYGIMEAQIDCTDNPDCVLPPDTPLLPHIPDEVPMPLPVCEKFPQNVLFPHPTEECKLCKCEGEMTQQGLLEPRITCIPDPECIPGPETITTPKVKLYDDLITPEILLPIPVEPVPFPDVIVTPEPLPRPLVTTLSPIGPGPLPGPPPHESCKPFQPGQTFQHPWDECQVCVCTEARDLGLITIEINCYTKKSCCYETSNEPDTPDSPAVYYTTPSVQVIDKLCEFKTFGAEFVHPQDNCRVCTCELFGGLVKPSCKPAQKPECVLPNFPATSSEVSEAQALAASQENAFIPLQPSTYNPLPSLSLSNMGASNLQTKGREKLIQTSLINLPLGINKYPGYLEPGLSGLSGYNSQQGYQEDSIHRINQNSAGSIGNEALVNSYSDVNQNQIGLNLPGYNQFKQILGSPLTGSGSLQIDASLPGLDQQSYYPGYQVLDPFWSRNKGQKTSLTGYNNLFNPLSISDQLSSLVNMNTQPLGSGGGNFYQGIPTSNNYPTLYSKPSYKIAPLYYSGQLGFEDLPAQVQSLAHGLGSQSHELTNAARVKTKSGEEDSEIETTDDL